MQRKGWEQGALHLRGMPKRGASPRGARGCRRNTHHGSGMGSGGSETTGREHPHSCALSPSAPDRDKALSLN